MAIVPLNPHFDLPFRFLRGNGAAVEEQDSYEDIANCVECICRCPYGFRVDNDSFGFPSVELLSQPVVTEDVIETVSEQEPRAILLFTEQPDTVDVLIDRITVEVRSAIQTPAGT